MSVSGALSSVMIMGSHVWPHSGRSAPHTVPIALAQMVVSTGGGGVVRTPPPPPLVPWSDRAEFCLLPSANAERLSLCHESRPKFFSSTLAPEPKISTSWGVGGSRVC